MNSIPKRIPLRSRVSATGRRRLVCLGEHRPAAIGELKADDTAVLAGSLADDGRQPLLAEKCEAIIWYAEHDAYLPLKADS